MKPVLLTALILALAPPEPAPERIVYLDTLLSSPSTRLEGLTPYRAGSATFGDRIVRRSLMTEVVTHANVLARYSAVTFTLGRKYERFEALLGRDNAEAVLGRSYCHFEVYADGKRVYVSPAIRSALTDTVAHGGLAHKVKFPQSIALDVSDVEQLKLVVQLPEFRQSGERVNRASGCVWGEARLTLKPGERREEGDEVATPTRRARLALARAVPLLLKRAPKPSGAEAVRLAVAPLQLDPGASDTGELREYLRKLLLRQPSSVVPFTLLEPGEDRAFLEKFADGASTMPPGAIASAARNVGADLVLLPALVDDGGWKVELRLIETADGATLASVRVPLEGSAR